MKHLVKVLVCFCLAMVLICLSACEKNNADIKSEENDVIIVGANLQDKGGSAFYTKSVIDVGDENVYFSFACSSSKYVYLYGTDTSGDEKKGVFYKVDPDTFESSKSSYFTDSSVSCMTATETGILYVLEYKSIEGSNSFEYTLNEINAAGDFASQISLDEVFAQERIGVPKILAHEDGIVLCFNNEIVIINYEGNIITTIEHTGNTKTIAFDKDGSVLICGAEDNGYVIEVLSGDFKSSEKYSNDGSYTTAFDGFGSDGVFLGDTINIYSVDYKSGSRTELINLVTTGININYFASVNEELLFSLERGVPTSWRPQSSESQANTVFLKLATYNIDRDLSEAVLNFNNQSESIKIEVIDYAMYNSSEASDEGLLILNTDIISGNLPDIFDLSSLPGSAYAARGFLEDLMAYIKNDADIEYTDFVNSAIKCLMQENGCLYDLVPGFDVITLVGNSELTVFGDGWTPEQFYEFAQSNGLKNLLPAYLTREDFIAYMLIFDGDNYMDYSAGKCYFDSLDFSTLLEFAGNFLSEDELDVAVYTKSIEEELYNIYYGSQRLATFYEGDPLSGICSYDAFFGGETVFIGFPSTSGSGSAMSPLMRLGMSSQSDCKAETWEFFEFLLGDEYQNKILQSHDMSIMRAPLTKHIDEQFLYYSENPLKHVIFTDTDELIIQLKAPDESTLNRISQLINSIDCIYEVDTNIYNIVLDTSAAYYAGERSIEDTIAMIQSKAQIYMGEQYS